MGTRRDLRKRAVLLVDDEGWASFDQVAAGLRRRGVRVVRVTCSSRGERQASTIDSAIRWFADNLLYHQVISLAEDAGRRQLSQMAAAGVIADAVMTEPTLEKIGVDSAEAQILIAHSLAFRGTPSSILLDKLQINRSLEAGGVPIPTQLTDCSAASAIAQLGLPLVVKTPLGAAGYGVRIAESLAEAEQAVLDLREGGQEPFFQAFEQGPVVMYGAVLGPGGVPLIEHGFRVEQAQSHLGPSAAVSLHDRPELLELGRRAAALFKPEGFAAFGFIETEDGRLLHIDANLRVWGNIASPLKLGIDYLAAYVALLRQEAWAGKAPLATASSILRVYPYALFEAFRTGDLREIATNTRDFLRVCRAALGSRYCLQTLGQAAWQGRRRWRSKRPA